MRIGLPMSDIRVSCLGRKVQDPADLRKRLLKGLHPPDEIGNLSTIVKDIFVQEFAGLAVLAARLLDDEFEVSLENSQEGIDFPARLGWHRVLN